MHTGGHERCKDVPPSLFQYIYIYYDGENKLYRCGAFLYKPLPVTLRTKPLKAPDVYKIIEISIIDQKGPNTIFNK